MLRDHPQSAEAREARRALKILLIRLPAAAPAEPAPLPPEVVVRQEPYSLRTSERMRLTTWEKLDFGVTSFLYGLSVGVSYGLSVDDGTNEGAGTAAMALGAVTYTLGSVGYLSLANPSRGDLPLALGIASYLPTTTLLVSNLAVDGPDDQQVALATAATGLLAVPLAVAATHWLDLDPGDTQLVRDAGFWGLVLGTAGTLGFGGDSRELSETSRATGNRAVERSPWRGWPACTAAWPAAPWPPARARCRSSGCGSRPGAATAAHWWAPCSWSARATTTATSPIATAIGESRWEACWA